ncbi:MAG TPA: hypothetical protein VGG72_29805 [Bryobacteraceae bacterium]|jgi:hypothetical protein
MKKRFSIGYDLNENGRYDSLMRRLRDLGAEPSLPTQWLLLSSLTAEEIRLDLQAYIDPADRLLVTQVASMSCRNLINDERFERGAA